MPTMRQRLAAFSEMHNAQSPTSECRMRLTDAEALALIDEIGAENLEHKPAHLAEQLRVSLKAPMPEGEDAVADWAIRRKAAREALWDALAGTTIDGVVILRRPT